MANRVRAQALTLVYTDLAAIRAHGDVSHDATRVALLFILSMKRRMTVAARSKQMDHFYLTTEYLRLLVRKGNVRDVLDPARR